MKSNTSVISFQALLITLVLLLFVPSVTSAEWLGTVSKLLYTFTMLSSLYLVSQNQKELVIGIVIFVPTLVTRWTLAPIVSEEVQLLAYCTLQVFFLAYVMRIIYRHLLSVNTVNEEVIYASVALYLMFGICLAIIYFGIVIIEPLAFGEAISTEIGGSHSHAKLLDDLIYFSFVTQTTLGYGDISPKLELARTIATFQAIIGQLYIAVVVARLVGIGISSSDSNA